MCKLLEVVSLFLILRNVVIAAILLLNSCSSFWQLCDNIYWAIPLLQITYAARVIGQFVRVRTGEESIVSYLPLSHIAAQLLDMYLPMCYAATVYFAQPDALKVLPRNAYLSCLNPELSKQPIQQSQQQVTKSM